MRSLYLCGAGNAEGVRLALRINEATSRWDSIALLDDDPARHGQRLLGVPVVGGFDRLAELDRSRTEVANLVARTACGRERAGRRISAFGVPFTELVSRDVDLLGTDVAPDLIVYPNATIGPAACIREGGVVFMGAAVGHESHLGRHCVVAANAVLNARVRLGDRVYVGSGAVVLPEVEVGTDVTVGAGAVVISDVPDGATVVAPIGRVARATVEGAAVPGATTHLPRREIASALTRIWQEVIGQSTVSPSTNFFDCGGTSLLALRMLQRVESELEIEARLVDVFQYPSIERLAGHLERTARTSRGVDHGRLRAERRRRATALLDQG